jgi:hypothetical protein
VGVLGLRVGVVGVGEEEAAGGGLSRTSPEPLFVDLAGASQGG